MNKSGIFIISLFLVMAASCSGRNIPNFHKADICECKEENKVKELIRTENYLLHYNKDYLFILHSNYTGKSYIEHKAVSNAEGYKEIATRNGYTLFVKSDLTSYIIYTPKKKYYLVD